MHCIHHILYIVKIYFMSCLSSHLTSHHSTLISYVPSNSLSFKQYNLKFFSFCVYTAQCPALSDVLNSVLDMSGRLAGSTATYTCKIGYELNGAGVLTCQSDTTWDHPPPNCVERTIGMLTCAVSCTPFT